MYLEQYLKNHFPPPIRDRGGFIFRGRKVSVISGNQWQVNASIVGSYPCTVSLARKDDRIEARCECAYYVSEGLCTHIWATLLAADQRNLLQGAFPYKPPREISDDLDAAPPVDGDLFGDQLPFDEVRQSWRHIPIRRNAVPIKKREPGWRELLAQLPQAPPDYSRKEEWRASNEIYYIIDAGQTRNDYGLYLEIAWRELRKNGEWGKFKTSRVPRSAIAQIPDLRHQEIMLMLGGVSDPYNYSPTSVPAAFRLPFSLSRFLLPKLCATGCCRLRTDSKMLFENQTTLSWDEGEAWVFRLRLQREEDTWIAQGYLQRGQETMDLSEPALLLEQGLLFARGRVSLFEHGGSFPWILLLRNTPRIKVPAKHGEHFLTEMLNKPVLPPVDWPEELQFEQANLPPKPHLKLEKTQHYWRDEDALWATLSFEYGAHMIPVDHASPGIYEPAERRYWNRDLAGERAAVERLRALGLKKITGNFYGANPGGEGRWEVPPKKLPRVVHDLVLEGWQIESEGKLFRNAGNFSAELTSGIDWFELHGAVEYGSESVELPALLNALERGHTMVALSDGSFGLIPDQLKEKYGLMVRLGERRGDHVRFSRAQAGLLDMLLAGREEVRVDEIFNRVREELRSFEGIAAAGQPEGFVGRLRDYQLEGLSWMYFLQRFGFGGCLADDMGVGKTPQVLALLETRREQGLGPSLAVVPRSLVFNWQREAERFTPKLRVLDHSGLGRLKNLDKFQEFDLILTTYGTLRRDAVALQAVPFDYVILDEAQAIKNANTESAKAARLLNGKHRLALSGTPVENHLGDLWSLFEFLNPGMLGAATIFSSAGDALRNPDEDRRQVLASAVRPFILRRTKDQVARELPPKTEQTLYCELDASQRKLYNELRDHYRASLLNRIDRDGMSKSRMHVLEALLRLRQAACHPGLIDPLRASEPSAKLEALMPQLAEVREEGHKALVFSQFTKFLGILRAQLDAEGTPYEYLDGQTRDREARVNRFQDDPKCKLFLVSLKAGGVGLNLCAAEYVFLLDPWWNPAVEAQAIDRAHRIGQTSSVFAYRLIARETVEEKVVQLQNTKRDLADAIIRADTRLVSSLKREDLELLLS